MTDQLAIDFDRPAARSTDPSTSHNAAVIAINRAPIHREKALAALRSAGERGMNDFELSDATDVPQTSIGVRRGELVRAGLVAPRMVIGANGLQQDKRPAPSGTPSLVWMAAEYQRADAKGAS